MITHIQFDSAITHAPVNASTSNDTRLLLWRSAVDHVPVKIELTGPLVYFPRIPLSLFPQRYLIACSNVCIQKIKIHIHARRSQILNSMCLIIRNKCYSSSVSWCSSHCDCFPQKLRRAIITVKITTSANHIIKTRFMNGQKLDLTSMSLLLTFIIAHRASTTNTKTIHQIINR